MELSKAIFRGVSVRAVQTVIRARCHVQAWVLPAALVLLVLVLLVLPCDDGDDHAQKYYAERSLFFFFFADRPHFVCVRVFTTQFEWNCFRTLAL